MNSGWKECKLGDVAEIVCGATPSTLNPKYWSNEINWVTAKDISGSSGYKIFETERRISKEGFENCSTVLLPAFSTVLIARGATMGKSAMVTSSMALNQTCYALIGRTNVIDPYFLFYAVKQLFNYFESIAHGAIFNTVIGSGLRGTSICAPPLSEQRAIAGVLSSLDDKIDLLRRQNKTLEGMAEALWRKMFIEDADPKWPVVAIENIAKKIQYGFTQSAISENVGPKFLRITDIQGGVITWQSVPYCLASEKDISSYKLYHGDIVVARTGASTGENLFIHNPPDAVFASYLIRIQCENLAVARFLSIHMRSKEYFNYIEGILSGSAQPNANAKQLTSYEVALPPLSLCIRFYDEISALDKKYVLNYEHIQTLTHLRDTLLPKLMSGEVRVKM